jgi:hypothetical protein
MSKFSEWFKAMKAAEARGERPHVGPFDYPALDGDDNLLDYCDVQRWVEQDALEALTVVYTPPADCGNCLHWRELDDQPGTGQCMSLTDDDADAMKLPLARPVVMLTHRAQSPCALPVMRCGASRWEQKYLTIGGGDG